MTRTRGVWLRCVIPTAVIAGCGFLDSVTPPELPTGITICDRNGGAPTTPPQSITGALAGSDCRISTADLRPADLYTVVVPAGQSLVVTHASTAFTPVINVYDLNGVIVYFGDTTKAAASASIALTSPIANTYLVALTARVVASAGAYTANLSVGTRCTLNTTAQPIALGETISGTLSASDCIVGPSYADVYKVTITAATNVRADLASPGFDSFLFLADSTGTFVQGAQTAATAVQVQRTLAPGTYYLVPNASAAGQTGSYTLALRQLP